MKKPIRKPPTKATFRENDPEDAPFERETDISDDVERKLRRILEALNAVRQGDLTRRLTKEGEDIFGELADSYNAVIENLTTFFSILRIVGQSVGR